MAAAAPASFAGAPPPGQALRRRSRLAATSPRTAPNIACATRAHVLLCWLALLLIRVAERQTGQTWRRIALELQRLHLVTLTGTTGTAQHTTALTAPQRDILTALRIDPPPRVTALTPA